MNGTEKESAIYTKTNLASWKTIAARIFTALTVSVFDSGGAFMLCKLNFPCFVSTQ
jgi:hypothetical protein